MTGRTSTEIARDSRHTIEVYPRRRKTSPGSEYSLHNGYWIYTGESGDIRRRERALRRHGYGTLVYPAKYGRSDRYRRIFFAHTAPTRGNRYHCVYCGRLYPKSKITVDHVVPVYILKRSRRMQRRFSKYGSDDPSNLVAACWKCNLKKGTRSGLLWRIRASFGRHYLYFVFRRIFFLSMCAWAAVTVFRQPSFQSLFRSFVEYIGRTLPLLAAA